MSEIEIRLDWREIDIAKLQGQLTKRFFGRRGWSMVAFVAALTAGLALALLETFVGPAGTGLVAAILGILVFALVGLRLNKTLITAVSDAPVRQEPTTITIGPEGIAAPGALLAGVLPWRWVTDVVDTDAALLILYSPVEFIPVVDAALPAGITRGDLALRVAHWREAAI